MTITGPLRKQQGSCIVLERCVMADTRFRRLRGLLGRSALEPGEGLYIATWSIHTAFMRFPIDAVFVDRNLVVTKVVRDLRPWRAAASRRAHGVAELAAGEAARAGIEVGDRLALTQTKEHAWPKGRSIDAVD